MTLWLRWTLGLTGTRPYPHVTTWLFRVGLLAVGALGNVAGSLGEALRRRG
jgi:hypothetical protein